MSQFLLFLEKLKTIGLEAFGKYYSTYPGIVSSIDDPQQRGRIQVIVPSIFDINYVLPAWAEVNDAKITGSGSGEFFPPYVGGYVEVSFEHGDLEFPMYSGGFIPKGNLPADFTNSYGNVRGWVFKSGQKVIVDETSGATKITIYDPSGSQIQVTDGKIAMGTSAVELLEQISNQLEKMITWANDVGATHTHEANLGYPTLPPDQADQYIQLGTDLKTIMDNVDSIKGAL